MGDAVVGEEIVVGEAVEGEAVVGDIVVGEDVVVPSLYQLCCAACHRPLVRTRIHTLFQHRVVRGVVRVTTRPNTPMSDRPGA